MTRNTLKGQKQLHSVHQAKDRDQDTVREEEGGTAEMQRYDDGQLDTAEKGCEKD